MLAVKKKSSCICHMKTVYVTFIQDIPIEGRWYNAKAQSDVDNLDVLEVKSEEKFVEEEAEMFMTPPETPTRYNLNPIIDSLSLTGQSVNSTSVRVIEANSKVCLRAMWPIRLELIPVYVA